MSTKRKTSREAQSRHKEKKRCGGLFLRRDYYATEEGHITLRRMEKRMRKLAEEE